MASRSIAHARSPHLAYTLRIEGVRYLGDFRRAQQALNVHAQAIEPAASERGSVENAVAAVDHCA